MKIMDKLTKYMIYLTFSVAVALGMSSNNSYTRGLIKYLNQESKLHQVMFIIDDQLLINSSSSANSLITDVSEHFPSFSTSLSKLRISLQKHFPPASLPPRRTTLFIMILNGTRNDTWSNVYFTLMQLKELSHRHSYPKCLINLISQNRSHLVRDMLGYFWSQDFLDIKVLEHLQKNQIQSLTKKTDKQIQHTINIFAKIYRVQKVSARTKWFPDPMLKFQGHQIKFLASTYNELSSKDLEELTRLATILSNSLKSSHNITRILNTDLNLLFILLRIYKAEMILNLVDLKVFINGKQNNPNIRILGYTTVKAVIPNISRMSKVFTISQEFAYMIIATIVLICAIQITSWILKFNRNTWQIFSISQIIIGMSIVREPRKRTERIVFAALILSCIVYSGYLYSVILDINFQAEDQISTLEELADSSLTPTMNPFTKETLLVSSIGYIRKLGMKSVVIPNVTGSQKCLAYLAKYENITCIFTDVETQINYAMKQIQGLNVKVLEEPLLNYMTTWMARGGSPFLDRFNKVLLKASEAGLLTNLLIHDHKNSSRLSPPELIGKEKLLLIVFYLFVIGYSLATIVFIVEMVSTIN